MSLPAAAVLLALACDRPDQPGTSEMFHFDADDVVVAYDTPRFRVHYTTAGTNAVPLADTDTSGVPDHVEALGALYEDVLAFNLGLGFHAPLGDDARPDNGGDGRFDVYLVDFNFNADGAFRPESCTGLTCSGFIVQENDFRGYGYPSVATANRILASHEFFHAVQDAYRADLGAALAEGTAVWATERFAPTLRDLEGFADAYLNDTGTPLDSSGGPVDPFVYGTGVFYLYLAERYGDDAIVALLEASAAAPGVVWLDVLGPALDAVAQTPPTVFGQRAFTPAPKPLRPGAAWFADSFAEFAGWTLMTGDRARPVRSFARGAGLPELSLIAVTLPHSDDTVRVFRTAYTSFIARTDGRDVVAVARVGTGLDSTGVYLQAAPLRGDHVGLVQSTQDARLVVDTSAADSVLVQVVNTRRHGEGARPGLCIGSTAEVDACVADLTGVQVLALRSGFSAAADQDADGSRHAVDAADSDASDDAGGCHQTGAPTAGVWLAALVMASAWRRRC